MSWLSSFLHPEKGYQGAQGQLDKYYNEGQGYQQPYNQNGINQGKTLTDAIQQFVSLSGKMRLCSMFRLTLEYWLATLRC